MINNPARFFNGLASLPATERRNIERLAKQRLMQTNLSNEEAYDLLEMLDEIEFVIEPTLKQRSIAKI